MHVLCMLAFKPRFSLIFQSDVQTSMGVCLLRGNVCHFSLRGVVLSKLCVLSRFTGILFPQLCGCRVCVCVTVFLCVAGCTHSSPLSLAVPVPDCTSCQHASTPTKWVINPWALTPFLWQNVLLSFRHLLFLSLLLPSLLFQKLSPYRFMNINTI